MKHKLVLLIFTLALCAFCLTPASCAAISKADAINLGGKLALSSLNLAARVVEGEKLNLKVEAGKLGIELARDATTAAVINASESAAKDAIAAAIVESPKVSALADSIAAQATDAALTNVQGAEAGH